MPFGLDEKTIQAIQGIFARYPQVEHAILYGSRAKGNYHRGSDIDINLVGSALTLSVLFSIENELDDLLLPYKIDLSIRHTIENPDVLNHIARVGQVFYKSARKTSYNNII